MKTELGFLLDLLLNHKLPKATRELVAKRATEVELSLRFPVYQTPRQVEQQIPLATVNLPPAIARQAPSTQALLAKHPDLASQIISSDKAPPPVTLVQPEPTPVPVEVIAQTPAAQAALNARNEAIAAAISGKAEAGRKSPRKFHQ